MLETIVRWIAYFGGWLLVAGPVLQARLEFEGERTELAGLREDMRLASVPKRPSPWWWLLPPVAFIISRRAQRRHLDSLSDVLTAEQLAALGRYFAGAFAWMIVAAGATFIAVKETYELSHHTHWESVGFWALAVLAVVAVSLANGAASAQSSRRTGHQTTSRRRS